MSDVWAGDDLSFRVLSQRVLVGRTFEGVDLRGADLRGVVLQQCTFTDCDLSYANLTDASLEDCTFARSAARFAAFVNSTWSRVRVVDEFDCEHASASDVKWLQCDLSQIALRFASLRHALLSQVVLVDADLSGVDARDADFNGSTVRDCDFRGALLHRASFEGVRGLALIDGLSPIDECRVPPPLRPSHNTVTVADLNAAKHGDELTDGLRLAPDVAQVVARALGVVDAPPLASEPLAIVRLADGTTFERHPGRLLRVIGPPPARLTLVRHVSTARPLPLSPDEEHEWRSLDDELTVYDSEARTWSAVRCSLAETVVVLKSARAAAAGADPVPASPRDAVVNLSAGVWVEPLPDVDDAAAADAAADGFEAPRPNAFMVHRPIDYQDCFHLVESLVTAQGEALRGAINRLRLLAFDERRHQVFAAASAQQRWKWVENLRTNIDMSSAGFNSPLLTAVLTLAVGGSWATPECTVDWQQFVVSQLENCWPSSKATRTMHGFIAEGKLPWLVRKRIDDTAAPADDAWSMWLPSSPAFDDASIDLLKRIAAPAAAAAAAAPNSAAPVPDDKTKKKKKNVFGFLRRLKKGSSKKAAAAAAAPTPTPPPLPSAPAPPTVPASDDENDDGESSTGSESASEADEKAFGEPGTVATLSRETLASFSVAAAEAAATKKKKKARMHGHVCARCGERASVARAVMSDGSKLRVCLACIDALKQDREVKVRERERLAAAEAERQRRESLPPVVGNCHCCGQALSEANTTRRAELCLAARNADVTAPFGLRQPPTVVAAAPAPVLEVEKKSKKSSKKSDAAPALPPPPTDAQLVRRVAELERELAQQTDKSAQLQVTVNEMRARLLRLDSEASANEHVDDLLSSLMATGDAAALAAAPISTPQSLLERQVEALKGALAQEYAARSALEAQIAAQAEAQFSHLQDAQTRIGALQTRVDTQAALLARLALNVCDACIGKL